MRLLGSHCTSCNSLYFPSALSCRNPLCKEKCIEDALLPNRGVLYSYTIQRYRPPPMFQTDSWEPYALGLVDLGEGLRVMGMLSGMPLDAIKIGMRVQLIGERLFTDAEGNEVLTYKFAPDNEGPGS